MDISKSEIVIATHYLVYGAPQALRDYLLNNKIKELLFIGHPLIIDETKSFREIIIKGSVISKRYFPLRAKHSFLNYFPEFCLSLFWVLSRKKKYNLFIGVDGLNAFVGIILRKLGRVNKVVFYTIDYVPIRFPNKFFNRFYHWLDKFCLKNADETWNVSPRIAEGREKIKGLKKSDYPRQKVVPIGVWLHKIKRTSWERVKKHQLLFVGNLLKKQGVQLVIQAIPEISKKIPDFHFLVIGGGEYENNLKKLVQKVRVDKYVTFTGWIKERKELEEKMRNSALAVAMYEKNKESFTYYADPTKIKDYLSMGIPVLLTDLPYNAKEIEKEKCGIIVDYKKGDIADAIIKLMGDEKKLQTYRQNALSYAKRFDWNKIFKESLEKLLL